MDDDVQDALVRAARATAAAGLVDAFGHVSMRTGSGYAITPPVPLGTLTASDAPLEVALDASELPAAAPREAWLHSALYRRRPATGAICRAQPRAVAAFAALDLALPALNGHAALLGRVARYDDSRLVRDAAGGDAVATAAGDADAIILRGNGAVTLGADPARAVARMWLLERSCELALRALASGMPYPLPDDEQAWWRDRADELLPRVYRYLTDPEEGTP
jgi:HCOMODA/2-hydroxy-3-carboxy-muconic semialdehyde decarboxylase